MNTEKVKNEKSVELIDFLTSIKLVMIANRVRKLKPEKQAISVSLARVISWIYQKEEFSRCALEKALCLTFAQSEWHINELVKKGIIKRTNKFVHKIGKGQRRVK